MSCHEQLRGEGELRLERCRPAARAVQAGRIQEGHATVDGGTTPGVCVGADEGGGLGTIEGA